MYLVIAPEIFSRQYYGQEVDWWSLGVLACFMLTNQVCMIYIFFLFSLKVILNMT